MAYKDNEYSFQIGAEINADIKNLKKQLDGLIKQVDTKAEGTFVLNTDEAKKSLDTLFETVSKIKETMNNGVKINVDSTSAKDEAKKIQAIFDDVEVFKLDGKNVVKDSVSIQKELSKIDDMLNNLKKTKLNQNWVTKDLTTGELKNVVDENGKNLTLYDRVIKDQNSYFAKVENASKGLKEGLAKGGLDLDEFRKYKSDLDKMKLAIVEAENIFNQNSVGNAKSGTIEKSEQIMLYKEYNNLKREENALNERAVKLSKEKNQSEITALNNQLAQIAKRKQEIDKQLIDKNLVGKFFENDLSNLDQKGKTTLIDRTSKEFDSLNSAIDTQNNKLVQAQQNIEEYLLKYKNLTPQAREELERLKNDISKQITDNNSSKNSSVNTDILQKDKNLAEQSHQYNLQAIQDKNTQVEVSKLLLDIINQTATSMNFENKITTESNKAIEDRAKLLANINGLLSDSQKYSTTFIKPEDRASAEQIAEKIRKIKTEIDSINTSNLTLDELVQAQNKIENGTNSIKRLSEELSNLSKNNLKIKAELDFEGAIGDATNKINDIKGRLSKEISQLQGFKITNPFGDTSEVDNLIQKYRQLLIEQEALRSQPITNTSDLIEYNDKLNALNQKFKEIKTSASSINIDAGINRAYTKMVDDSNAVVMKTREMEEAMKKALAELKNIDNTKMQQLLQTLTQIREEAEKTARIKLGDFNAGQTTSSLKGMKNQLKEVNLSFTQLKNDAKSWDRALGQFFDVNRVMGFTAQFSALRGAIRMITREVQMLDTAMTTLKITVDGTEENYKNMTSAAADMAREMGATYSKTLDLLQTYANATDSMESIMAKLKPTLALSNISGMGGTDTVNTLQAIMEQFKLVEKAGGDVEAATYRVADGITSISKSLKMDFADGIAEIADGIKVSGAVVEMAGIDMETYAAMVSAVIEQTRMAGKTVGTAFRTITSRILNVKDGDITAEDFEAISTLEKKFEKIGVKVRKSNDEFRDLQDILKDLAREWQTMSDVEQSEIAELAAGKNQANVFKSLMQSMDRVIELEEEAANGAGAALLANEKYMDSYTGKMNTLKGVWQNFSANLVDSGSFKTFMDGVIKLVETLNTLSPVIGFITTMSIPMLVGGFLNATLGAINTEKGFSDLILKLTGFNIKAKETTISATGLSKSIKTVGDKATISSKMISANTNGLKLHSTQVRVADTTTKSFSITQALTAVKSITLAGAIQFLTRAISALSFTIGLVMAAAPLLVGAFNKIVLTSKQAKENVVELTTKLTDFNNKMKDSKSASESIEKITKALAKYGDIPLKTMPTDEVEEYKKSIETLKELYPDLTAGWTTYADVKKEDLDLINEKLKLNNELEIESAKIALESEQKSIAKTNKNVEKQAEKIINLTKEKERVEGVLKNLEGKKDYDSINAYGTASRYLQDVTKDLSNAYSKFEEYNGALQEFRNQAALLEQHGIKIPFEIVDGTEILKKNGYFEEIKEEEIEVDARIKLINSIEEELKEVEGKTVLELEVQANMKAFNEAKKAQEDILDLMQKIVNAQDELSQTGQIEQSTISSLGEHYSGIYEVANDRVALQSYLNSILEDEQGNLLTQTDLMNQYYGAMFENDNNFYKQRVLNSDNFTQFLSQLNGFLVQNGGENYTIDANNFDNLTAFKIGALETLGKWIKNCAISEAGLLEQTKQLMEIIKGLGGSDFEIKKIKTPSIPKSTYKAPTTTKPKTSSTKTEKEVADLKLKINLYYKWEKAIKDVEHQMSKLDKIIDSGTGREKVAAIKKQIELYKELEKQQKALYEAQKKELANLQKQVSNKGFRVEANGTVANYTAKLQELEKWANKAKGDEKEKRKEEVNAIKELLDSYTDLVDKMNSTELDIAGIDGDIKDKQEELKDFYDDLLDTVKDVESEITSMITSELEKRKDAMVKAYEKEIELLNKAKEAYQKQNEEEDYQEEHDKQKQKIAELQNAINLAMRDTSLAGKKQLAQLQEQMKEAMEELAEMEKEKNRKDQEDWFDEEITKLEEEQAKKEEEWDEKYDDKYIAELVKDIIGQGFTTIEGQVVDLTTLMTDNFTDGLGLIGDKMQSEFLDKLEEAKEIASNISNIFKEIGVNLNPREGLASGISSAMNSAVKTASLNMSGEISSYLRNGVSATPLQNNNAMSIGNLLQVNGNIDRAILPNLEDIVNKAVEKMQSNMKKQFRIGTGRI